MAGKRKEVRGCRARSVTPGRGTRPGAAIAEEIDLAVYPDVVIDCEKSPKGATDTSRPVIIFEVLSPGTRQKDMRRKAPRYRRIPTVKAVVLVEQDTMDVEVHRRVGDTFVIENHSEPADVVGFPDLGVELTLAEIYDEVFD